MSDKQDYTQTESGAFADAKPTKKQAIKAHLKRFWWVHFIIFLCLVVLGVCLTIFVGVPRIAQTKLNHAKLEIQGVNVLETTPTQYRMEINSTIETDGTIKAKVFPFEGNMYLEDAPDHTPFATLQFPQTSAAKHQNVNISQIVQIKDQAAFDRFNIWFANNETLRVTIEGATHVTPSGLFKKFPVNFKKTLDVKGLNLFKGTKVTEGTILLKNDKNGNNFLGVAEIPNASDFALDIGDTTFTNFVGDEKLGELQIKGLFLARGINTVNITANLNQGEILALAGTDAYCHTGIFPFKLLGKDVTNNGKELTYFRDALASANQTVDIDIGHYLKKDIGYNLTCSSFSS